MSAILINQSDPTARSLALKVSGRFGSDCAARARTAFAAWLAFEETPLIAAAEIAAALGIGELFLKDERTRLDLDSFKGLGGAYAVFTIAAQASAIDPDNTAAFAAFIARRQREATTRPMALTVATATAGNHGRSVAAGARLMGIDCVIFVYDGVPAEQIAGIAAQGARIIVVEGAYEEAVETCRVTADSEGWLIVSDTAWAGYSDVPLRVMEGYTVMAAEAIAAMDQPPTHVFLQAGVGGMAAAVAAHICIRNTDAMPKIIVVEPDRAPCLYASAEAGHAVAVPRLEPTSMGRLECYAPSLVAWPILQGLASAFVKISDEEVAQAIDRLARWGIETTPSGGAGFAGLLAMLNCDLREEAGLNSDSRVLVFLSERMCAPAPAHEPLAEIEVADAAIDSRGR
jgi:diaminopropionate ammonia-lyase